MEENISNKDVIELYYPDTILPEVPVLGWQRFSQGAPGGVRPSELKTYEICYVEKGSVEWWIDDQLFEAAPKSLFINKPGEWHGGASGLIQPCEMYFVQFMFPPLGALPGLSEDMILEFRTAFEDMHHRVFFASNSVRTFFELLLSEQRNPQRGSLVVARAAFHQILAMTVRNHDEMQSARYSKKIAKVLDWINDNLEQSIHCDTLIELSEMSPSQFYRRFSQEVRLTPGDYHLRQRILVAKHRLRKTQGSITDIALELGFSSSQYFATVFKKVVGLTPSEYRAIRLG
jgi:AraC family L-rhamnose operon regulatory protein RhaS